ncbi:uncharacterized protein LOC130805651 [Amaranthus tricolor]|uniref:uncharacterized protein LOC130805651 n=1 Tax=Amaranthus tricolor TaxID=29722 RepID=UPI002590F346|nr:uncharacterized protein LOC130805651 [Amaranthus tricolor]
MADQIKNLQERIEPHQEISKSHESQNGNSRTSHSSRRNKRRRERSRILTSLHKTDPQDDESKTASQDARTFLESKKQRASESVQSLVDKRKEERKKAQVAGSSRHITMPWNEAGKSSLPENLMPIISPLAPEILNIPNTGKIKIPNMAAFDGTSCPEEHLMAYKNLMLLYTTDPLLWCKFFPTTLTGVALTWYTSLPGGSIHNFAQLEGKLLGHFVASRRQEKSNFHLLSITQLEGESISSYLKKFHEAVLEVTDLEESVALNALINGMKAQRLKFQFVESQVKTYAEAIKQCQSYVMASEICQAHDPKKRRSDKKDLTANHSSRSREEQSSRREKNFLSRRPEPPSGMGPPRPRHVYVAEGEPRTRNLLDGGNDPLFNRNRKDIFFAIRDQLPTPHPTATPSDRHNYNLWFINRKDYDAGREAERRPWNQRRRSPKRDEARRKSSNTQGTINMIFGGYTEEYPTIRAARNSVHTLLKGPPKASSSGPIMRFDATTSQTLQQSHTDPLVVTLKIRQMKVKRVLVDTGSTYNPLTNR